MRLLVTVLLSLVVTTILLLPAPTPTVIQRYVNPNSSGGNGTTTLLSGPTAAYASLAAAELAERTNLVLANSILQITCSSNGAADTTQVDFSTGWATDASHYIYITGDPNYRNGAQGSWGKYDTSRYRLEVTNPAFGIIQSAKDIWIDRLQFKVTVNSLVSLPAAIRLFNPATNST